MLAVTNPKTADSPNGQDVTVDKVIEFAKNSGVTYPIAMDTTGDVFAAYGIRSFPTTFMIDVEGNVFGYVAGALTRETMDSIVEQTIANVPAA
ncbi:MAG: TlpA disulfide reductase family protein [Ruthenibacterium sp.]